MQAFVLCCEFMSRVDQWEKPNEYQQTNTSDLFTTIKGTEPVSLWSEKSCFLVNLDGDSCLRLKAKVKASVLGEVEELDTKTVQRDERDVLIIIFLEL